MTNAHRRLSILALVLTALACRSNEVALTMAPSPHRSDLVASDETPLGRVWIAVPAAVRALPDGGGEGPFLQVLVRVENVGGEPIAIDPARIQAIDEQLAEYLPASSEAPSASVAPGAIESFAYFLRYPAGVAHTGSRPRGLEVRVPFRIGEREYQASAEFERVAGRVDAFDAPYYDPWHPYHYWSHWYWNDHHHRD